MAKQVVYHGSYTRIYQRLIVMVIKSNKDYIETLIETLKSWIILKIDDCDLAYIMKILCIYMNVIKKVKYYKSSLFFD